MNFNPYLVFDVPMSADYALLRATYRRLARENHPDVAPDKILATERMAQINRAWGILGDEAKRAAFDAQWRLQNTRPASHPPIRRNATAQTPRSRVASAPARKNAPRAPQSNPKTPRGAGAKLRAKLGLKAKSRAPIRPKTTLDAAFGEESASPRALRLMRKITLAQRIWHRDGNAKAAIEMCRAVLLADGRNVPARELLSEIFASQGRLEIAVMMLDQALQITPDDLFLRRKRDFLEQNRFPGGGPRAVKRPSLWQRLRAQFQRRSRGAEEQRRF